MHRLTSPDRLAAGVLAGAGAVAFSFVRFDGLGSFADDSVSYMVMARHLALSLPPAPAI